jgi:hypothetical protein
MQRAESGNRRIYSGIAARRGCAHPASESRT